MAWALAIGYCAVAIAAAVVVFVASERFGDQRRPAPHRTGLSLAAGAVWPMVLLGVLELTSVAMYAKAYRATATRGVAVLA